MKKWVNKKGLTWVIVILIIILSALWFFYFKIEACDTMSCFQDNMKICSRANYINEVDEASWGYRVSGPTNNGCKIEVKLLQAKEGNFDINELEGESMFCYYPIGTAIQPEKDLSKCHGILKEDLQQIIIDRLHKYLLENLGEVDSGLNSII